MAYSGIASCYLNLWFYRHLDAGDCLPALKAATKKAMQIDDEISDSYVALARMQMLFEWDFKGAHSSLKKAFQLGGNSAELHNLYALFCSFKGKHDTALKYTLLALELEPYSLFNHFYSSYIFWLAGKPEDALLRSEIMLNLEPNFWGGHFIKGLNLLKAKNNEESIVSLRLALKNNYSGITLSASGVVYGLIGQKVEAEKVLADMHELKKKQPVSNYDIGIVYFCMGEIDTAFTYFEAAIEKHEPSMLFFKFIIRDWLTDFLHDSRYLKLISKIS